MNMLGSWAPEGQTLLSPYAAVAGDMVILPTMERHIFQVERVDGANYTTFNQVRDIDLTTILPQGHGVVSSYLDEDENIWFTSVALMTTNTPEDSSILGYVTPNGAIHTIAIDGQRIENSIAASGKPVYLNTGFLASDTARSTIGHMFAFRADASDGHIKNLRNATYGAGSAPKPGGFSQGSGSTPALIGDRYVAITDNADVQVNLLIYRQVGAGAEDGQAPLVCAVRWALDVRSTSVLSLSTANGLVYSYTQDAELASRGVIYMVLHSYRLPDQRGCLAGPGGGWWEV